MDSWPQQNLLPLLQAPSFRQPPCQPLLYEPEAAFRPCPTCPSSGLSSKPSLKAPPSSHLDVLVSAPYTCPSSLGAALNHQPESGNHPFRVLASPSSSHLLFSLPQLTSQLPPHHQIHLLARLQVLGTPCLPPRGTPSLCQRWANSYSFGKASGQGLSSRSPSCAPPARGLHAPPIPGSCHPGEEEGAADNAWTWKEGCARTRRCEGPRAAPSATPPLPSGRCRAVSRPSARLPPPSLQTRDHREGVARLRARLRTQPARAQSHLPASTPRCHWCVRRSERRGHQ